MRFLCDMGISVRVAEWLRHEGHDCIHLREESLQRLPNGEIFAKAIAENRVVVTVDLDFGEIAALSKGRTASVIVLRLQNTRADHIIERLAITLKRTVDSLIRGAVVTVEEARLRVRELPIVKS